MTIYAQDQIVIKIVEKTLSDGSTVYDVVLGNIRFPSASRHAAEDLAEELFNAIINYSSEAVKIQY